jgi:Flp pilus assembly protein TadD
VLLKQAEQGDVKSEDRALSLFKRAISLDSSQAEPFYQLGNLALTKGNLREAMEYLKRAAELNRKDSRAHFALSKVYRRLGRAEQAEKEFQLYQKLKNEQGDSSQEVQRRGVNRQDTKDAKND